MKDIMRASELMIGDLVRLITTHTPIRVGAIPGDAIVNETDTALWCEGDYEPIPLTAEILEKNGWKNKLWWEHSDVGFYMSEKTDGTWEIQTDKDSEFSTLCSIRYVHELQHLLRLCGIEKEIVL